MDPKVIILVGLPNSGKSTYAEKLALKEKAVIISSDQVRESLFGNISRQRSPHLIFAEVFVRAIKTLKKGQSVIIDSTNISRKRRLSWVKKFNNYYKECYYFSTPFDICLERNTKRKRKVDEEVMTDMYKHLHMPMKREGWDVVHIVHSHSNLYIEQHAEFEELIKSEPSYEDLFNKLTSLKAFKDMYQFNQENPHHKFTVCMHTYEALKYINENYTAEDKFMMQLVALFHDSGKPFCKFFRPESNHASFYGHENVSAQLCSHYLHNLGYEDDFILKVTDLVQLHMKLWKAKEDEEVASELYQLVGDEALWKLYLFGDADIVAKG